MPDESWDTDQAASGENLDGRSSASGRESTRKALGTLRKMIPWREISSLADLLSESSEINGNPRCLKTASLNLIYAMTRKRAGLYGNATFRTQYQFCDCYHKSENYYSAKEFCISSQRTKQKRMADFYYGQSFNRDNTETKGIQKLPLAVSSLTFLSSNTNIRHHT